jgi:hypothetical protein
MTKFRTVKTVATCFEPQVGRTYRFVGDSLSLQGVNSPRHHPFMVVEVVGDGALNFQSEGEFSIGWVALEGPNRGTVYRFGDVEEVEPVETKMLYGFRPQDLITWTAGTGVGKTAVVSE